MKKESVGTLGLILNAIGAFVLVIATTGDPNSGIGNSEGIIYSYVIINDLFSKLGLLLFIFGFLLQILERQGAKDGDIAKVKIVLLFLAAIAFFYLAIRIQNSLIFH
jgi:hypothetical protein